MARIRSREFIDRPSCHREVAVGYRQVRAEIGAIERRLQLDERVEILGDLPQQKVGVAPNADQTIGPQQQAAMIALERLAEFELR